MRGGGGDDIGSRKLNSQVSLNFNEILRGPRQLSNLYRTAPPVKRDCLYIRAATVSKLYKWL